MNNIKKKRKSFLIYKDSLDVLDDLDNNKIAELFLAIKDYQNGVELNLEGIVKIAFSPFKNQFMRDEENYLNIVKRNRFNGLKGGRPKNPTKPKKPTRLIENPTEPTRTQKTQPNPLEPKKPDSDSDSDSDSGSRRKEKKSTTTPNRLSNLQDESFFDIKTQKDRYLKNEKLVASVCETLKINKSTLKKALNSFNKQLKNTGVNVKAWIDYTSHFLNWARKEGTLSRVAKIVDKDDPWYEEKKMNKHKNPYLDENGKYTYQAKKQKQIKLVDNFKFNFKTVKRY